MKSYLLLIIAVCCAVFALSSLFLLEKELDPFLAGDVLAAQHGSFYSRNLSHGYSSKSKFLVLSDCLNGMQLMQIEKARLRDIRSFSQRCARVAGHIVAAMPTNAYAFVVKAWAGGELFESQTLNDGLRYSHLTAPNELWLAKVRVELAERKSTLIQPETRKIIDNDIAMMAGSYEGVEALAVIYSKYLSFRERVVGVVENLPRDIQLRFLYKVRSIDQVKRTS